MAWTFGFIYVSGIAYLVRPWRYLQAALTAPALFFIPHYWLVHIKLNFELLVSFNGM